MSFRPSSRSSSSTSSGSSTRTCREKRLPNSAAVDALVYFCGRDPRKVKAMRVYETTYLDNDPPSDDFDTRSSSSSSRRSTHSGLLWISNGSQFNRTKQEFYFIESRGSGYGYWSGGDGVAGAEYNHGVEQQPKIGRESRASSKRSSKSGGSSHRRHKHSHGHRQQGGPPPSDISEGDEEEFDNGTTNDSASVSDGGTIGSGFSEYAYHGGPASANYGPSTFPPGQPGSPGPGMMPSGPPHFSSPAPPGGSYPPSSGGFLGYHQQQQQPMYNIPPPMPSMTPPHGFGGFHPSPPPPPSHMPHHPGSPPLPMMSGGGGGDFQQDGNGIQVFMPE